MKLTSAWNLFKKGGEVSNPGAWKNATIVADFLAALVVFLAEFNIIDLRSVVDSQTLNTIALGGIAVGNIIATVITSKKVGISNKEVR